MKKKLILISANVHLISYIYFIKLVKKHLILSIIYNGLKCGLAKYNFKEYHEQYA